MSSVTTFRDEAVVLRTHKLGEADRIITLLTRHHGRVRAVAKGVRRTSSRFGSRLEPFMVVDVQLWQGRSLDIVTQVVTLSPYGGPIAEDYTRWTAATAMAETAERMTENEREPATQQFLLLVGGLRTLAEGSTTPPSCSTRSCCARCRWRGGRRRSTSAPAAAQPGTAPGVLGRERRSGLRPSCRPPGSAAPAPDTVVLLSALLTGRLGGRRRRGGRASGARPAGSWRPTCSGTSSGVCARCSTSRGSEGAPSPQVASSAASPGRPVEPPPPHPCGVAPPDLRPEQLPGHVAVVMDGNGRWANQRGLPRTAGHEAGELALFDLVAGAIEVGVRTCRCTPSPPRTGSARRTRCAS